jgi:hypothetical protein
MFQAPPAGAFGPGEGPGGDVFSTTLNFSQTQTFGEGFGADTDGSNPGGEGASFADFGSPAADFASFADFGDSSPAATSETAGAEADGFADFSKSSAFEDFADFEAHLPTAESPEKGEDTADTADSDTTPSAF